MLLKRKALKLGLILLALVICSGWGMHKFYVSLTEISFNSQTEDRALLERTGIHTQLATELEHPKADSLLMEYLLEDFSIQVNGEKLELNYLGKEPESDAIWCYLESSKAEAPVSVTVRNTILTEYFPDQVNIVQVYHEKWNKGLLLNRDQHAGTLNTGSN